MRCAIAPVHHRPPVQSLRRAKDRAPHKTMNTIKMKTVARLTPDTFRTCLFTNGKILGLFNNDCSKSRSLFPRVGLP